MSNGNQISYSEYTDDELREMAGIGTSVSDKYADYSDDELREMAGVKPSPEPITPKRGFGAAWEEATTPVQSEGGMIDTLPRMGEKILRTAGHLGETAGDVMIGAAKAAYKYAVPPAYQAALESSFANIADTDFVKSQLKTLRGAKEAANVFAKEYPRAAEDIEAGINAINLIPAYQVGKFAIGAGAKNIVLKTVEQEVAETVKPTLEKTILSSRGKYTAGDVEKYLSKGTDSVTDIVKNKETLKYTTTEGELIEGKLPKNYSQWNDAIYQREGELFKEYDAMNKAAGGKGAKVDLESLANKLDEYGNNKVIISENPAAAKYALQKAEQYRVAGSYTAEEAQQALVELNKKFEAFLKNPSPEKAVDVISGNNIRQSLYDAVMSSEGEGYEQLRKAFGAHKEIEMDVTRKAIAELKKTSKVDWLDIIAGAEFTTGLLALNPLMMTRAGVYEGLKRAWKWYKSPQREVKNMFAKTDKVISGREAQRAAVTETPLESIPSAGEPGITVPPLRGKPPISPEEVDQMIPYYNEMSRDLRTRRLPPGQEPPLLLPEEKGWVESYRKSLRAPYETPPQLPYQGFELRGGARGGPYQEEFLPVVSEATGEGFTSVPKTRTSAVNPMDTTRQMLRRDIGRPPEKYAVSDSTMNRPQTFDAIYEDIPEPPPTRPIPPRPGTESPVAPIVQPGAKVRGYLDKIGKRLVAEAQGEGILNSMEASGKSPLTVSKEFWDKTYWNLPAKEQAFFKKQLENHTGTGKRGIHELLKDQDLPDLVEYLEGTDRGYVSLMEYMNQKTKDF